MATEAANKSGAINGRLKGDSLNQTHHVAPINPKGKVIPITERPPEYIRKAFPGIWYHPKRRLLTWYPRGVLNEAFADQVIEFIEMEERIQQAPFDRYLDLSGLTYIRIGIDHIIHTARRRRTVKQPVKTALFANNPMSFGVAHSYELLMHDAMIQVRAFKERVAVAQWPEDAGLLGVDKGNGVKLLMLPPDYKGKVPEGYQALHPGTWGSYALIRSSLKSHSGADVAKPFSMPRVLS